MAGYAAVPNAQFIFQQQYDAVRRDEVVGVLLALFLGCFGVHHFYLGRIGTGILYCVFCWTGIPAVLGVIECFFMPGRVRRYNAGQAAALAAALGIEVPAYASYPGWSPDYSAPLYPAAATTFSTAITLAACPNCQQTNPAGSRFCSSCGNSLS